ncbi:uncharacterized protein LOC133549349 [Nerophis ophidion]|uniref:uncharacterized protein LOC133549349 n=1 Tax=Nerophis ophidion TaxID=159077 RepID=UPI002ADF065D|nr:uncharacterized protein LOC133549349 [Nerophis ophidion]
MDTFFRRHFRKKAGVLQGNVASKAHRQRRTSMVVLTGKVRRTSSVGLPSSTLTQRRRSSVHLQGSLPGDEGAGKSCRRTLSTANGRRRSSTTTPNVNPRFAVTRKLRTIDTPLVGPSILLASLIQMAEEDEEEEDAVGAQHVELKGEPNNGSQSDANKLFEGEENITSSPSSSSSSVSLETSRALTWAPRCLRRNSSQVFAGDSTPNDRPFAVRRRRRVSTVSKPRRRSSVYYINHPAHCGGLEDWSILLSYVNCELLMTTWSC